MGYVIAACVIDLYESSSWTYDDMCWLTGNVYSTRSRGMDYCNEHVAVYVCVCPHIIGTTCLNSKFSLRATCGRSAVLSGGIQICHALLVLWMMSCLLVRSGKSRASAWSDSPWRNTRSRTECVVYDCIFLCCMCCQTVRVASHQ